MGRRIRIVTVIATKLAIAAGILCLIVDLIIWLAS